VKGLVWVTYEQVGEGLNEVVERTTFLLLSPALLSEVLSCAMTPVSSWAALTVMGGKSGWSTFHQATTRRGQLSLSG